MIIRQYSDSVSGASVRPFAVDQPNIMFVGLSATVSSVLTLTGSNITQVQYEIGGMSGDATIGAVQDNTTFQFNIENLVGTATLVPYELMGCVYVANGDITSRLYDNIRLLVTTSGASSPEVLVCSASFDEERYVQSTNKQKARVLDIQNRKTSKGETDTIKTLSAVAQSQTVS
jgi:hypothetical protein